MLLSVMTLFLFKKFIEHELPLVHALLITKPPAACLPSTVVVVRPLEKIWSVSYTHLTLPTICSV